LPIVIKLNFHYDGTLTTGGHPLFKDWKPLDTSPIVQKLIDEGAIVVAKTNMPELASSNLPYNNFHGTALNPVSPMHISGGSSSGTAAAISANYVTCGLGTDTLGSTR
jgi:Asp-tRNA(Asn)/Glu-tRNA(Gln) amidotransferase A subunit family amidase